MSTVNSATSASTSNATDQALLNALLGSSSSTGTSNTSTTSSLVNTGGGISFGGLVSGLSTQSIIQATLAADQAPLTLLQNEQTTENNKLTAWQDLQTKLQTLQNAADTLSLQATAGAKTLSFSGPSGTYATGTASSSANPGTFNVAIAQIATSTTRTSTTGIGQAIVSGDVVATSSKLATPVTAGTFTIDNTQITVTAGDSIGAILNNIKASTTAAGDEVDASIVGNTIQLTRPGGNTNVINLGSGGDTSNFLSAMKLLGPAAATTMTSTGPVGEANANVALDSANLTGLTSTTSGVLLINGVSIDYNTKVDSLNDVLNRINSSSAGVTASYDGNSDSVTIKASATGNVGISVSDAGGNLLASLGVTGTAAQTNGLSAEYQVNGGPTQFSLTNSVNNIIPGVNLTLQQATPSGSPLEVTVAQDTSVAEGALQTFVTAYNAVVNTIQTDTAFDSTNNTSGVLFGDPTVSILQQELDQGIFIEDGAASGLPNGFTDVTTIGLNTGAVGSAPGTTTDLQFDSTTFGNAMASNPSAVVQLVTKVMGGFSQQLLNITQPFGDIDNAIKAEQSAISDLQDQINTQNDFISQEQTSLNAEYTAMETLLAQIESQSSSGASALSSLNGTSTSSTSTSA